MKYIGQDQELGHSIRSRANIKSRVFALNYTKWIYV